MENRCIGEEEGVHAFPWEAGSWLGTIPASRYSRRQRNRGDGFASLPCRERLHLTGHRTEPDEIRTSHGGLRALIADDETLTDYLSKPFTPQRFRQALQRAKSRIGSGSQATDARVLEVLERIASQPTYLNRIAVRGARGTSFVDTKDMDWLKAAENYVELHVGPACHLVEATMAEIAKRLDPARFVRIHRSVIVNTERIRTVQPASHWEYLVTLASGTQLRSGRTYRETMQRLISNPS